MELHLFSDASEKAYGTVAYIRSVDSDGKCRISLVASKTRVAPLRKITLPRLELLGCLLSVRLANSIKEALLMDIPTFFWSDSQVALSWILKKPTELKQFVANRVAEIQRSTTAQVWNFVPGKENPADLCSRGASAMVLTEPTCIWWCGPEWFIQPKENWPASFKPTVASEDA